MLRITAVVHGVDGETKVEYNGPSAKWARNFLEKNAHEGCGITVEIAADDEDADELLKLYETRETK